MAALGELSANNTHKINNPLAIIRQQAEIMGQLLKGQAAPNREELQESVEMIIQPQERQG
jgi:C4-dicarboxylate-specific signal transduction histidine kinase